MPVDHLINEHLNKEELDPEWMKIVKEAMVSGVSKDQFREFLDFNKWRVEKNKD